MGKFREELLAMQIMFFFKHPEKNSIQYLKAWQNF
jgi:hypothetical protein